MYKKSSTSKGALIGAGVGAVAGGAANYFRKNKDERSAKDALIGAGVGAAAGGGIGAIAGHVNGKNKDSDNKQREVVTKGSAVERLKARMAEDRADGKHIPNRHTRNLFRKYREFEASPNPEIREYAKKNRLDTLERLRKSSGEWHKYRRAAYTKDEILERARSKD